MNGRLRNVVPTNRRNVAPTPTYVRLADVGTTLLIYSFYCCDYVIFFCLSRLLALLMYTVGRRGLPNIISRLCLHLPFLVFLSPLLSCFFSRTSNANGTVA